MTGRVPNVWAAIIIPVPASALALVLRIKARRMTKMGVGYDDALSIAAWGLHATTWVARSVTSPKTRSITSSRNLTRSSSPARSCTRGQSFSAKCPCSLFTVASSSSHPYAYLLLS
ncbi:hypothetical protein LB505_009616 [Fusarium chuoi]|nr:hypothetical protein LB505_009616 [Fusarium chuoi]